MTLSLTNLSQLAYSETWFPFLSSGNGYCLPFRAGDVRDMNLPKKFLTQRSLLEINASPLLSVLRSAEALRDAREAPARLHLPPPCAAAQGAPLHPHPAHLPGPALGHQGIAGRHCLPDDGEF